jgi:hypothetical protein
MVREGCPVGKVQDPIDEGIRDGLVSPLFCHDEAIHRHFFLLLTGHVSTKHHKLNMHRLTLDIKKCPATE